MSVQISELRIGDAEPAADFARQAGAEVDPADVITALSLMAHDGEAVAGAILCTRDDHGRHHIDLALPNDAADQHLAQTLISKTLMKLQSRGVNIFRIQTHGGVDASWLAPPAGWAAPDESQVDQENEPPQEAQSSTENPPPPDGQTAAPSPAADPAADQAANQAADQAT